MANCNYKVNLTDIQNKYKFKIFNTGSYNDSDLRKMIESVFYALPRTTGSGTSVTLTDTAFSYMKNKLYATDTSQYTTTGKNLLETTINDYSENGLTIKRTNAGIFINGTANATTFIMIKYYADASSFRNKKFTITEEKTGVSVYVDYSENGEWKSSQSASISGTILTIPYINSKFTIKVNNGTTLNNYGIYPMVSDNGGDYEAYTGGIPAPNPDYPQTIHTITGNNNIKVESKNLFDGITEVGGYDSSGNKTTGTMLINSNKIYVRPNTTYIFSNDSLGMGINVLEYKKDNTYIGATNLSANSSFTTNSETSYINIWRANNLSTIKIQLEIGNSITQYKPYKQNAVLLTLGDTEICKIGNYEDKIFKAIKGNEIYDSLTIEEQATLDYGSWYLRKAIGKVVLDGTNLSASKRQAGANSKYIFCFNYDNALRGGAALKDVIKCDKLVNKTRDATYNNNEGISVAGDTNDFWGTGCNVYIIDTSTMTLTAFNTWLETNNLIVYYVLATPTNEKFNDTIQDQLEDIYNNMLSYEGQTNISQENADLPFNIEATAIKDLNNL